VTFAPAAAGSVTGSAAVTSNAASSPAVISLSGTGIQAVTHSVTLGWNVGTTAVTGYNVYRSAVSGGPYTALTPSPINTTSYIDLAVQSGLTYFYVATSVDSTGGESTYAPEISATIP
jgi:fibronectin type 3 domain-containing protein